MSPTPVRHPGNRKRTACTVSFSTALAVSSSAMVLRAGRQMTWRATLAACRLFAMTEAEAKDDALIAAAKSLPLSDRLLHSHWRVRSDAYADVVKEAGWAQDGTTQPLRDFGARQTPTLQRRAPQLAAVATH